MIGSIGLKSLEIFRSQNQGLDHVQKRITVVPCASDGSNVTKVFLIFL